MVSHFGTSIKTSFNQVIYLPYQDAHLVDAGLAVEAGGVGAGALHVAQGAGRPLLLHQLHHDGLHRLGRLQAFRQLGEAICSG